MKIQILMSTYNGGRYIRTQLESIAAQTVKNKTLLIRDDGSTDDTIKIIQEYQKQYSWISYYRGENIGVQRSFLELIRNSDVKADYIALSDQDDEWLPEKLEMAWNCLRNMENASKVSCTSVPFLYCSDKIIVGPDLEKISVTVNRPVKKVTFGNALVQNICTGCTVVMNQCLATLIRNNPPSNPKSIIMHDWWLYLTASCFGQIYYDGNAYIRYRQHGMNISGAMINRKELLKYRIKELNKPRGNIYRQVQCFRDTYFRYLSTHPEYQAEIKLIDKLLLSERKLNWRLRVVCSTIFFRQRLSDDLIFRGIVLLGKL